MCVINKVCLSINIEDPMLNISILVQGEVHETTNYQLLFLLGFL